MAATVVVKCQRCKDPFRARVADRNRGWGKFCSKSCKAIKQEQRTGQNAAYHARVAERESVRGPDADDWRAEAMFRSTTFHGQDDTGGV